MPLKLSLPSWLPEALLIKIIIGLLIGLGLFVWWRRHEAKIAEENLIQGIIEGQVRLEKKLVPMWEEAIATAKHDREQAQLDRIESAEQVQKLQGQIAVMMANLKKLTAVTLTMDERQRNYVEATNVGPDDIDRAILDITRQIEQLEREQQPVP